MQKWPVIAATFHKEKFDKLILVLFKADGEIDQFFLAVVKKKFREFFYFSVDIDQPNSKLMRRSSMHMQITDDSQQKLILVPTWIGKWDSAGFKD